MRRFPRVQTAHSMACSGRRYAGERGIAMIAVVLAGLVVSLQSFHGVEG